MKEMHGIKQKGFREGDKEGQTVPGPRSVGVILKQGIPI